VKIIKFLFVSLIIDKRLKKIIPTIHVRTAKTEEKVYIAFPAFNNFEIPSMINHKKITQIVNDNNNGIF
jgi:hypothetical protein